MVILQRIPQDCQDDVTDILTFNVELYSIFQVIGFTGGSCFLGFGHGLNLSYHHFFYCRVIPGERLKIMLFSTKQYAAFIGKSHRTVKRWCQQGKLDAVKVGSFYVIQVEQEEGSNS